MRYIHIKMCTISGSHQCLIAMFIILSQLFVLASASVVVTHTTEIRHEITGGGGGGGGACRFQNDYQSSIHQDWIYTAPARFVPAPAVDPVLQEQLLKVFQPEFSPFNGSAYPLDDTLPPGLSTSDLEYIATVCPKDAFFYSLSPQHVVARNLLMFYLMDLPSPAEFIRVAKIVLKNHEINAKIWYYAVVGAALERPDMNGYVIPQPLDAMPDLFIPAPALSEALKYSVGVGSDYGFGGFQNSASTLVGKRVLFLKEDDNGHQNATGAAYGSLSKRHGSPSKTRGSSSKRRQSRGNRNRNKKSASSSTPTHSVGQDHHDNDRISAASSLDVTTLAKENENGSIRGSRSITKKHYENILSDDGEGENDAELAELMRIHERSSNSTRSIRQRILQRRERRMRKMKRAKRQLFGSPQSPLHHDGIGHCVLVNGTVGADNGEENRLWYFREDLMLNQHHWYWHQWHPINSTRFANRRAELFFFLHRNIVARYNAERLSNGLPRTSQLPFKHGAYVDQGYNSHLIDMTSRKFWTPRDPHTPLSDIIHENDPDFGRNIFLKDLTDLYAKFVYSIKEGTLIGPNNIPISLQDRNGIEHLSNTVEATLLSVNPLYYNAMGIHNLGHQLLGLSSDPQYIARSPTGVMADTAVTMRDPVFYTFHATIDNLFDKYKRTLPPYQLYDGEFPLVWEGVQITKLEVVPNLNDGHPNHIRTFWSTRRFPLESGIDNSIHHGDVKADICSLHLNQELFTFRITVTVNPCIQVQSVSGQGMMRIFMAPRYDEYGRRFPLKVQRRLMFQLDVFPVKLQNGKNIIYRNSKDSSLTKPWLRGLRDQVYGTGKTDPMSADTCGCGWPDHLYIPKGSPDGMQYDLFAMITNFDEDAVRDSVEDLKIQEPCNSPYLFCGIPFRNYPDARPMGYPFDRPPFKIPVDCNVQTMFPDMLCKLLRPQWYRALDTLEEYVHTVPNMATSVVTVTHVDTIIG